MPIKYFGLLVLCGLLLACGSDNKKARDTQAVTKPSKQFSCQQVNWSLLLSEDAEYLDQYQLFESPSDPTKNPQDTGVAYQLNATLFTEYTSKYRFMFIPCGQKARYQGDGLLAFPVGSVLVKTFSMPADTGARGTNETLLETRLMILRKSGWATLPYVWDNSLPKPRAKLMKNGHRFNTQHILHKGQVLDVDYLVPSEGNCVQCHSKDGKHQALGPNIANLNRDGHEGNQLQYWQRLGLLQGLPSNLQSLAKLPVIDETSQWQHLDNANDFKKIEALAKSYLEGNCAHCHRPGSYWSIPPDLSYKHDFKGSGDGIYCRYIQPGDSANSELWQKFSTGEMPFIDSDKNLVHQEGLALIEKWIISAGLQSSLICP